ncbi:Uncharacterised protein [Mycobacteroides abscessus subsp. abscessus]|nr:Uncharacterised protein [Mycobacteroides abscessus subsp. abscessus]
MGTSYFSSNARINESGTADPPHATSRNEEMSRSGCESRYRSTSFQIVGTAPAKVGLVSSMIDTNGSAWRYRSGSTRSAPDINAA